MCKEPFVSILMPIRNEAKFIFESLNAVLVQDYCNRKIEVLIVDGMSTDQTRKIVSGMISQLSSFPVSILDNVSKIVPTGFNIALRHAKGEIIIRVDGHTLIAPDYVRKCVEALQTSQADNVGGRMEAISTTIFGKAVAAATSSPFGVGGARFHYSDLEEWVDTVYMGAWPRKVFESIGMFDQELVRDQDDEFNYRLREAGGKILLSPKIKSTYIVRSTPRDLWRQYFQYGFWKVRVLQKHPRQMNLRHFIPPAFVISLLVSALLAISPIYRPLSIFIPVVYLLANLLASLSTAFKHGWRNLLLLPLIFAILHISYGSGFLVGLFKFWNRWGDKIGETPILTSETLG